VWRVAAYGGLAAAPTLAGKASSTNKKKQKTRNDYLTLVYRAFYALLCCAYLDTFLPHNLLTLTHYKESTRAILEQLSKLPKDKSPAWKHKDAERATA
jgi:hypothetical protein